MKKIISSGSVAMDIIFECSELPTNDSFSRIYSERMVPGGSSSNVMVACACFGMEAYQTAKVGDDEMGRCFTQSLIDDHVKTDYVYTKKGGVTMHTYIVTAPGGQHTIFANFGTCMLDFGKDELPDTILDDIDIVYTDMFSPDVSGHLVDEGARRGLKVVYNMQAVTSFLEICGTPRAAIENALNKCSLLVGGRDPYLELVPDEMKDDIEAAVKYVTDKYEPADGALCTLGSEGAIWYDGSEIIKVPACRVDDVADTTGCGDAFIGSIMYAYYDKGMSRKEALDFANAVAAIKCTIPGPRINVSEEKVYDFKKSHKAF